MNHAALPHKSFVCGFAAGCAAGLCPAVTGRIRDAASPPVRAVPVFVGQRPYPGPSPISFGSLTARQASPHIRRQSRQGSTFRAKLNHPHRSLFALILIVLTLSGYAHAQQDNATPTKEEITELREKAFKLIDSVASRLSTLQSVENRARMGANVVDSLWKHDEERARSLLRVVQQDISSELQTSEPQQFPYDLRSRVFLKLRRDTIERIARHDAEAALEFLRTTKPAFSGRAPHGFHEDEQAVELWLAKQIAGNNPDVALKLGREALERGFRRDLLMLLSRLNRKHKQHGQTLFKEIVEKLRDSDLNAWTVKDFSQTLVQSFQPPDADEATYRELVGVFVIKAMENGCGRKLSEEDERSNFCEWAAAAIRDLEKYDSRAARLKHWVTGEYYNSPKFALAYGEIEDLAQEGDFEQLVALASKHPELQSMIYFRAFQQARASGNFEQAKKMLDRLSDEPERQRALIAQLEAERTRTTVSEEKLAELQRRLELIPNPQGRVYFLIGHANELGETDRKVALKLLNQAGEIIDMMKPGKEQTSSRVTLALMYCSEKSDRGFAIMESVVPKLNELIEIAAKLDGYDTNYLRDGEWNMSANGSIGEILTILSREAGRFAWSDFDRAVSLASQFERPEIRMMAHLKLAQGILAGPPKRMSGYSRNVDE